MVGCFTIEVRKRQQIKYVDVLLLAVGQENQGQGHGKTMMNKLKEKYPRILLWADNDAVSFYLKMGLTCLKTPIHHNSLLKYTDNSHMMMYGFSLDCLKALKLEEDTNYINILSIR
jgi:acetylglutamate synthase